MGRTFLKTALFWAAAIGLAAVSQMVQLIFAERTGETSGSFIFSSDIYAVNPFFTAVGILLGIGGFTAILNKWIIPQFAQAVQQGGVILWIVQAVLGLIGMLIAGVAVMLFAEGRMDAVFQPRLVEFYALWYPCCAAVLTLIFCILTARKIVSLRKKGGV